MELVYSIVVIILVYLLARFITKNFKIDLGDRKKRDKMFYDKWKSLPDSTKTWLVPSL
jgi:hypothetical protein